VTPAATFTPPARIRIEAITADGDPLRDQLNAFVGALVTSAWLKTVGADYGLPPTATAISTSGPELSGLIDPAALVAYVSRATKAPADPDALTIHLVFLPTGASYVEDGRVNCSCAEMGGAHFYSSDPPMIVGWVQRCAWEGHADIEFQTVAASHEIIEAATDPIPGAGYLLQTDPNAPPWQAPAIAAVNGGEVGDLCPDEVTEGPWTYTRSWSNARAAAGDAPCVPLPSPDAYFNLGAPQDWYGITPDGTVDVPLVAWSSGPRPDWFVTIEGVFPFGGTPEAKLVTSKPQSLGADTFYAVNNGDAATLHVRANGMKHGEYAVIGLGSHSIDPASSHGSLIGVYVE
jgi:hypothetical protein